MGGTTSTRNYDLSRCPNITKLSFFKCKLTELPLAVVQLVQLQHLNLSFNHLSILPETMSQLTSLSELILKYNDFTNLPDTLGQLPLHTLTLYPPNSHCCYKIKVSWLVRKMILKLDPKALPILGGIKYYVDWGDFVPSMAIEKVLYEKDTVILRYRAQTKLGTKLVVAKYYEDPESLLFEAKVGKIVNKIYEEVPHFVRLLAYDHNEERLIMEFVEGEELWKVLPKLSDRQCARVLLDILCILYQAQQLRHFTHYDLHGANVFLRPIPRTRVTYHFLNDQGNLHTITISRRYYPTIIDFGNAYVEGIPLDGSVKVCLGETRLMVGRTPALYDPIFDGFTLTLQSKRPVLPLLWCQLMAIADDFIGEYCGFEDLMTYDEIIKDNVGSKTNEEDPIPLTDQVFYGSYRKVPKDNVMPWYNGRKEIRIKNRNLTSLWGIIEIYTLYLAGTLGPPSLEDRKSYLAGRAKTYRVYRVPAVKLDKILTKAMGNLLSFERLFFNLHDLDNVRSIYGRVLAWINANDRTPTAETTLKALRQVDLQCCQYADLYWGYSELLVPSNDVIS